TAKAIEKGAPTLREQRPDLPRPIVSCVDRALSVAPGRRPTAAGLAGTLREAAQDLKRPAAGRKRATLKLAAPTVRHAPPSVREVVEPAQRALAAAGAASAAGMTTHLLPFFPAHWPLGIAAVAALLTAW